jgi:hypothetical protein
MTSDPIKVGAACQSRKVRSKTHSLAVPTDRYAEEAPRRKRDGTEAQASLLAGRHRRRLLRPRA